MKLIALESLDPAQLAKAISRFAVFKKTAGGINNYQAERKAQPKRSGNTETPVKPEHKGLMGQPSNPHGTIHDKHGRATTSSPMGVDIIDGSNDGTRPTLVSLGQPFERGLSDDIVGDGGDLLPVDKDSGDYTTRRDGPAEDPGRVRTGTLGFNRSKQGSTRYMG